MGVRKKIYLESIEKCPGLVYFPLLRAKTGATSIYK